MKRQTILTGYLLIFAAFTFWLSWFLMPGAGTTDTHHNLTIVKESRESVLFSVITQISSAVLYGIALFLLVTIGFPQRKTLTGVIVLGIGAMGLCVDAFFHLLAWFMTDDAVTIQEDVVRVMEFMQTDGLLFLAPLLLPFFIGSLVLASGLHQQKIVSAIPKWIFMAILVIGPVGALLSKMLFHHSGPVFTLAALGIFSAGHVFIGFELIRGAGKTKSHQATFDLRVLTRAK
jgi:hypothetical protein